MRAFVPLRKRRVDAAKRTRVRARARSEMTGLARHTRLRVSTDVAMRVLDDVAAVRDERAFGSGRQRPGCGRGDRGTRVCRLSRGLAGERRHREKYARKRNDTKYFHAGFFVVVGSRTILG